MDDIQPVGTSFASLRGLGCCTYCVEIVDLAVELQDMITDVPFRLWHRHQKEEEDVSSVPRSGAVRAKKKKLEDMDTWPQPSTLKQFKMPINNQQSAMLIAQMHGRTQSVKSTQRFKTGVINHLFSRLPSRNMQRGAEALPLALPLSACCAAALCKSMEGPPIVWLLGDWIVQQAKVL